MNEETSKPVGPSPATVRRPRWVRLAPFFALAVMIAFLLFAHRVVAWLETDFGIGFVGALLTVGLLTLALLLVPLVIVLSHEHRRNRV